jgi:hypothetical protein
VPPFTKLRTAALEDLARQLRFAPPETLRRQLERAETLAGEIDPAINYPEDWIVFRITGYRPEIGEPATVVGEALLGDISGLVERLSAAARISHADLPPDQFLSAEAVCERWAISTRTLERWRRLGLIARRVRGQNGKPRLAFPIGAVERFERERKGKIEGAAGYSRVPAELEERMLRRAAAYARLGCSLNQAAGRIAGRYGRALETVRQLLRRNDQTRALFDDRGLLTARQRLLIERAWWLAIEPRDVARRLERSTASILRVVNDERAARLKTLWPAGDGALAPAESTVLADESIASGLGDPGRTDLLEFIRAARLRAVPIGVVERGRARAYQLLLSRARAATAALPRHGVSGAAIDAIETDLRWAMRLKVELVRSQLPLLIRTLEAALERPLDEARSGLASAIIATGLSAIAEAVDAYDPDKGGRLAAPAGIAVQRAAAKFVRDHAPELVASSGRATPRLSQGVWVADWTRSVSPWQAWNGGLWLEADPRLRAGAERIDSRLRRLLALRQGWGEAPLTIAAVAKRLGLPAMRAAVMERRAVREARRAAP